jgi:Holliday junction resolvase RusA-like endonuclease
MNLKVFYVDPVPKPRMTKADRWKKRPCVERYWQFKAEINAQKKGFELPESGCHIIFYIEMPKSWSKKKKSEYCLQPHQQKPDGDNLIKGLQDALCSEDKHIWNYECTKIWDRQGRIEVYYA